MKYIPAGSMEICKTCRYAKLVKHPEHHINHPDYLEARCLIPLFAQVTGKNKCKDYELKENEDDA